MKFRVLEALGAGMGDMEPPGDESPGGVVDNVLG